MVVLLLCALVFLPTYLSAQVCTTDDDCSGDDACISGLCVAPVDDLEAYAAAAGLRESSYMRMLQMPALFDPPESCCFDLDDEPGVDDGWGDLAAAVAGLGLDPQASIDASIADLEFVRIFDWTELPAGLVDGPVRFSVFDGFAADGVSQSDLAAGTGSVILDHESFGTHGAFDQFNDGSLTSGLASATGSSFLFILPHLEFRWVVPLRNPQVEIPLAESPAGCSGTCTVDETRAKHDPPVVGGAKLGGVILADDYLTGLDAILRTCECAGVNPDLPVLTWGEGKSSYEIACTDNTGDTSGCDEGSYCLQLETICLLGSVLPTTLDIDHSGSGIEDSWSVGLRFSLSGTQIDGVTEDPTIFADGFESGDTLAW